MDKWIKLIVGRKKNSTKTSVQSVLFDKSHWTPSRAKKWLSENGFKHGTMEPLGVGKNLRFRQHDPKLFTKLRTKVLPTIKANPTHSNYYVAQVDLEGKPTRYWAGMRWEKVQRNASLWHALPSARNAAQKLADKTGLQIGVITEKKKYQIAGLERRTPKKEWLKDWMKQLK